MFLLMTLTPSYAQPLTSGADFLKVDSGARSQGMGGAFTAVADDVNALTWNPAGLALLTEPQVGYLRMLYLSDIAYNFGGAVIPIPMGENSLGLGAGVINLGATFDSTNGAQPSVTAGENAFFFSAAYRVKDLVSFGLTGKYILRDIAGYQGSAFGGDLGVLVTPPGSPIRVGAGVFNLGQEVAFVSAADQLPLSGRLGLAGRLFEEPQHSLMLAGDFSYQFSSGVWEAAGGAEYWYDRVLAVRAGSRGNGDMNHWTAGIGVDLKVARVDYAYSPVGTLGDTHRMSLVFKLGSETLGGFGAPSGLSATGLDSAVVLSWKPVGGEVAGYNLYLKKPSGVFAKLTGRPTTDTSAKFTKLKNGTQYVFAVSSITQAGKESPLVQVAAIPKEGATAPVASSQAPALGPPTGFKARSSGEGVELYWDLSPSSDVVGYNLYMMDVGGGPGRKLTATPETGNRIVLKKLSADKTYRFVLTAVSKSGKESVPTEPPLTVKISELREKALAALLPPPGFTAVAGNGQVRLSWEAAEGAVGYHLFSSTTGKKYKRLTKKAPLKGTQATLKKLVNGRKYWFAIATVDASGKESKKLVRTVIPSK
jgi:fibronectin type 3 domain-containing protein